MKKLLVLVVATMLAIPALTQTAAQHFDGKRWWEYVKVLADDNMEGRETGSPGLRKAETYVVDQLKQAGLQPAGTDGFYQPVKFQSRQVIESQSSAALVREGKVEPLTLGEDAVFSTRIDLAPEVEGPLVFVGYGLSIPEKNYDDLAGLDLKGKIVVIFRGAPAEIPGPLYAHYQTLGERWKALRKAGAIGIVSLLDPNSAELSWPRIALNRAHPNVALAGEEFDETAGQELALTLNPAKTEDLFKGSGHTFQEIAALAKDKKPLPRFPLPVSLRTRVKVEKKDVESANIVAEFPGNDAQLKNEFVILSAHIDHVGIGEPVNGDVIYNGAMDNGSGSALLLDVAASLKKSKDKPKRSILFLFVTGEEEGLLGSKYFAIRPTVDLKTIVADINADMFLPIIPLKLLTILGLAESDLGDTARAVAQSHGITVQADPEPQRNLFVRSDQYSFIRRGVPALAMDISGEPGSPEQAIIKDWLKQRYHMPSDDLNQPVDLPAAAQYEEVVRDLLLSVADSARHPQWKPDSFFRRYAQPAGE